MRWPARARDPVGLVSAVGVLATLLLALAVPWLSPIDPNLISDDVLAPPLTGHGLGTDELGRPVGASLLHGLRVSLAVGLLAATAATVLGVVIGASAGYLGGWVDTVAMRIAEVFQVMPTFILAAVIVALLGSGLTRVILVIALLSWPESARVMRAEVLRVKELEYVDAVRCLGLGEARVMALEVIPNALAPVLAVGTLVIGRAILLEASLSFLGLSSPDVVTWGRMAHSGQQLLYVAWWLSVFPGLAVFAVVVLFNLLGDAVGRALAPGRSGA